MNNLDLFSDPDERPHRGGPEGRDPRRQRPRDGRQRQLGQRQAQQRQRKRRRSGKAAFLFSMAFLVAVVGTAGVLGAAWLYPKLNPPDFEGQGSGTVTIQIKDGDSGTAIASTLEKHGVVASTAAFLEVFQAEPKAASVQPGFYQMRKKMSSAAAVAWLLNPKAKAGNQITVPEGLRAVQVAERLAKQTGIDKKDFLKVIEKPDGLGLPDYAKGKVEGYLFPGQYNLNPNGSARDILKMMVDRFKSFASDYGLEDKAKRADMKPGEAVAMASLIQSESGRDSDMPKIAQVIYNRLDHEPQPMFLKFDSTTLYALDKYGYVASSEDIRSQHPYNTYQHPGLPPGAISNPGKKALDAVFEPADGSWLFFVAVDPENRITKFATTEKEFNKLRDQLNKYLAEKDGN